MRRSVVLVALAAFTLACKTKEKTITMTEEEQPRLATMLTMSDPRAPKQLLLGFYALETSGWRWTAGHFTVILRAPRDSAQMGASLKLKFSVPQPVLDRVKSTALTATVGTVALAPETYTKAGDYEYVRDVPASALPSDTVKVDFALSKFLAAGVVEGRELGVIVTAVGLEHK